MKKDISPKTFGTTVLTTFVILIMDEVEIALGKVNPLLKAGLFALIAVVFALVGDEDDLKQKLWNVIRDRGKTPDQKCADMELLIVESVARWNALNTQQEQKQTEGSKNA